MNFSENISEITKALCKVQSELKPVKRDSNNPFFKSKYADLEAISEACRELLARNNIAVSQVPVCNPDGAMALLTTLMHESGQWIRGIYPINPVKEMKTLKKKDENGKTVEDYTMVVTSQAMGSAITYARRYSLAAMVGVVTTGEDDDGNTASNVTAASVHKNSDYDKAKAGWVMPFEGDWSQWVATIEWLLEHVKSMDDVSMLKKANRKSFKELEAADKELFSYIKGCVETKANSFM